MKSLLQTLLLLLLLLISAAARAQVGIGTTSPDSKSALDIRASDKGLLIPRLTAAQRTAITAPPQGLMVYQTDGTTSGGAQTGFWYYAGTGGWVFISPANVADNLGNHTATQNLNLTDKLLVGGTAGAPGTVGLSLLNNGDAHLGLFTTWQNAADDRLLKFGDNSFVTLGEVGADDLMQLRAKSFSFLPSSSASGYTGAVGIGTATPASMLHIYSADNPTVLRLHSSAAFGSVGLDFYSDPQGAATEWRPAFLRSTDAGSFTGGLAFYTNGTGSSNKTSEVEGMRLVNGRLGIGSTAPFSQLANTATNVVGADGYGVGEKSLTWSSNLAGYAGAFFNANAGVGQNGLAVKVAGANGAATAFDVSQGPTAATAGASLLTVRANGLVGIRSSAPNATLEVRRGTATDGTAAFWGTARTSHFNYSTDEDTYIRGGKATSDVLLNDNGGNVGVGTAAPLSRLSISPAVTEAKITLWDNGSTTDHYGFGVSGGQLNYHVGTTSDTHVFYASGKNGNGTELMRIQGNGTVGIGTSTPFATSRLYVQSRDLYGAVFTSLPTTALSQTEAVHAEVFTTQSIINAVGVFGQSVSGPNGEYGTGGRFRGSVGVQGESSGAGLQLGGRFTGLTGISSTGISTTAAPAYGIFAQAGGSGSGSKFAVYGFAAGGGGTKYAGYFDGDVYVAGNLGKAGGTFRIDHPQDPENKYLVHSFVESPEMLNVYRGHVTTDAQGSATATLPAYFEAENSSFEYHLTVVGQFAQVIVAEEVRGNQFVIATDKPNVKVSWQVTGARQDKWAQAHPINPEEPKTAAERGRYLLPELYGRPASEGIAPPPTSATPYAAGKMPTAGAPAASTMVR